MICVICGKKEYKEINKLSYCRKHYNEKTYGTNDLRTFILGQNIKYELSAIDGHIIFKDNEVLVNFCKAFGHDIYESVNHKGYFHVVKEKVI